MDSLPYKKMDPRAIEPSRANPFDAGLDLYGLEDVTIRPGEIVRVETGIYVALKENQVGLYWDKSGRTWKDGRPVGLTILGGCIDGPYRGLLSIILLNANVYNTLQWHWENATGGDRQRLDQLGQACLNDSITIPYGKAITQFLVVSGIDFPTPKEYEPSEWDRLYANTVRGDKGFGSSDGVRLTDGPLAGTSVAHNGNKDVIYEQGHRYVKDSGNNYRHAPLSQPGVAPLVPGLSSSRRRADGYED